MYCPKCGKKLEETNKYCYNCGYKQKRIIKKDDTKEIDISIIKNVTNKSNFTKKEKKNDNYVLISLLIIITLSLVLILLMVENKKVTYLTNIDEELFCSKNNISCKKEEKESIDLSLYEFNDYTSKENFLNQVLMNLNDKNIKDMCTNTKLINTFINVSNTKYNSICNINETYLYNLTYRLNEFKETYRININMFDSLIVGSNTKFSPEVIASNPGYIAYLNIIYLKENHFTEYEKISKTYERGISLGLYPKNSKPEDIILSKIITSFLFNLNKKNNNISDYIIDDFKNFNIFYNNFNNEEYSKKIIKEAIENINKNSNNIKKSELELKYELSSILIKDFEKVNETTVSYALIDYLTNKNNASTLSIEISKIIITELSK